MRRRGHGEGSIYRRADGRWVAVLDLGGVDEKRCRKSLYGKTRREAAEPDEPAGTDPIFRLDGGTFGLLAVHLTMAMRRTQTLRTSDACREIYIRRDRMPRKQQRDYCPPCVEKKVPDRDASREFRKRGRGQGG